RPGARHLGAAEQVLPRGAGQTPGVPPPPTESRSGPYDRLSRVRMNAACDVRQLKPLFNGLLGDLVDERRHADKTHEFRYPTRSRNSERRTCPYRPKPASGRWCATPTYPAAARRPARCRGPPAAKPHAAPASSPPTTPPGNAVPRRKGNGDPNRPPADTGHPQRPSVRHISASKCATSVQLVRRPDFRTSATRSTRTMILEVTGTSALRHATPRHDFELHRP